MADSPGSESTEDTANAYRLLGHYHYIWLTPNSKLFCRASSHVNLSLPLNLLPFSKILFSIHDEEIWWPYHPSSNMDGTVSLLSTTLQEGSCKVLYLCLWWHLFLFPDLTTRNRNKVGAEMPPVTMVQFFWGLDQAYKLTSGRRGALLFSAVPGHSVSL